MDALKATLIATLQTIGKEFGIDIDETDPLLEGHYPDSFAALRELAMLTGVVQRVTLGPNDYPVLTINRVLKPADIAMLKESWGELIKSHRPIVLDAGIRFGCVISTEPAAEPVEEPPAPPEPAKCRAEVDIRGWGMHYCERPRGHIGDTYEAEGEQRHVTSFQGKPFKWEA